jgi:DNA-directed RNA polymerase subunit RPC12/RpoP
MTYQCETCGRTWDDQLAVENDLYCTRRCGGQLLVVEIDRQCHLDDIDFGRLPYPAALTAQRLARAVNDGAEPLKSLFLLKDCFEATLKYVGVLLLVEYFRSPANSATRTEVLLGKIIRPSLGVWVRAIVGDLSCHLLASDLTLGHACAKLFARTGKGGQPRPTTLMESCEKFVSYRNDALGHGAMRSDEVYAVDLAR